MLTRSTDFTLGAKNQHRCIFGKIDSAFLAPAALRLHVFARRTDVLQWRVAAHAVWNRLRILLLTLGALHEDLAPSSLGEAADQAAALATLDYTSKKKTVKDFGGREGIRTLDLSVANAALSQLSYAPISTIFTNIA